MKRRNMLAAALIAMCVLSGCGGIKAEPYLRDLERVLAVKDQVSRRYLEALETAKDYTEAPSEEALQNAKDACLSSMNAIADAGTVESELTAGQKEDMAKLGMDQADYMTPFLMQSYEKGTRLQTLTDVLHYLNQAPESNDFLALTANTNIPFEELGWQIDLLGLNHLLAEVPEGQLADFKTGFLENLNAFSGDTIPWGTDRALLEEQSETVFAQMEDLIGQHARQIGALYTETLEEKKRLGAELEAAGLSAEEAEELEQKVDRRLEEAQSPAE